MYLFVWQDGQSRIVIDNLTVGDIMSAGQGMLRIFRIHKKRWEALLFDENKPYWVPIPEARSASASSVKFHLP